MRKRITSLMLAVLLFAVLLAGCGMDLGGTKSADKRNLGEVTDLQLVLLNCILFKDSLTELEGKMIEGHDELIDSKYKENISGGDQLVDELKGYKLVDYDYGDITGFKAAAFTKENNLVIVYCGTDHPTDFVDDVFAALFDFSAMDGQAKAFVKDNVRNHRDYDLYITGYSMGGRLCYLGTEDAIDSGLGDHLKKVRTFNGLGVKEALDLTDSNLSNIHNLQVKFADKTIDYIVKGDVVSDDDSPDILKDAIGYLHIGTEFRVPCTNEIDTSIMKQHDLYSIVDYLSNHLPPTEKPFNVSQPVKETEKPKETVPAATEPPEPELLDEDFLIGSWSTPDGVSLTFYSDATYEMAWGPFPEKGHWYAEPLSDDALYMEMDGSRILSLMSMVYGASMSNYHFEILKNGPDKFYLVQVYGDYTAQSSPCKLGFTRNGA